MGYKGREQIKEQSRDSNKCTSSCAFRVPQYTSMRVTIH